MTGAAAGLPVRQLPGMSAAAGDNVLEGIGEGIGIRLPPMNLYLGMPLWRPPAG